MGERMDVQRKPETPYLRARHTVISIINMRIFKAWLQPDLLFNLTFYAKIHKENIDLTHQFTKDVRHFYKLGVSNQDLDDNATNGLDRALLCTSL